MVNKQIKPFVLAIIKKDNKFLLTKRLEMDREDPSEFQGMWQLPGGGVNYGETVERALIREVREELGIEIKIISVIPFINNSIRKNWQGVGIVMKCKILDLTKQIKLNHESSEYNWFSFEELIKLETLPGVKEAVKASE